MNGEKFHEALSLDNELQTINVSYLEWGNRSSSGMNLLMSCLILWLVLNTHTHEQHLMDSTGYNILKEEVMNLWRGDGRVTRGAGWIEVV